MYYKNFYPQILMNVATMTVDLTRSAIILTAVIIVIAEMGSLEVIEVIVQVSLMKSCAVTESL